MQLGITLRDTVGTAVAGHLRAQGYRGTDADILQKWLVNNVAAKYAEITVDAAEAALDRDNIRKAALIEATTTG